MISKKPRMRVVLETSRDGVTWQRARATGTRSALAALKPERRPSHGR